MPNLELKPSLRVLIACEKPDDGARVLSEVENAGIWDTRLLQGGDPLSPAVRGFKPSLVIIEAAFGCLAALNAVRQANLPVPFIILSETEGYAFRRGINVHVPRGEISRVGHWVKVFLSFKSAGSPFEVQNRIVECLRSAADKPVAVIHSETLNELRREARQFAKTVKERQGTLRQWTEHAEQSKQQQPLARSGHRPMGRPDPFISNESAEEAMFPAMVEGETAFRALLTMQADLARQLERLNGEIQKVRARHGAPVLSGWKGEKV